MGCDRAHIRSSPTTRIYRIELKESIFRITFKKKRDHIITLRPSAIDDSAIISQLEMDALCLSMFVKAKRKEYDLPPVEEEESVDKEEGSKASSAEIALVREQSDFQTV